jgi:putative endonuclease
VNAGAAAETLAAEFLEARGLAVVKRNYRCRGGEIDFIARDGITLVFVEVRLRSSSAFGGTRASPPPPSAAGSSSPPAFFCRI